MITTYFINVEKYMSFMILPVLSMALKYLKIHIIK